MMRVESGPEDLVDRDADAQALTPNRQSLTVVGCARRAIEEAQDQGSIAIGSAAALCGTYYRNRKTDTVANTTFQVYSASAQMLDRFLGKNKNRGRATHFPCPEPHAGRSLRYSLAVRLSSKRTPVHDHRMPRHKRSRV